MGAHRSGHRVVLLQVHRVWTIVCVCCASGQRELVVGCSEPVGMRLRLYCRAQGLLMSVGVCQRMWVCGG